MKISNKIYVKSTEPYYKEILKYCKENLVLNNPEYVKKERMGFWVGNTPKKLTYFEINQDTLILPFGLIDFLKKHRYVKDYTLDTHEGKDYNWNYDLKLYDYQDDCSKRVVKAKHGIFISPAGSGKTQIFVDIILKLKKKALIIVHTNDLLKQAKDRIEGLTDIKVGVIAAGKIKIQDITVATVQTLSKMDLQEYAYEWGTVVVDEVHRCMHNVAKITMFGKVMSTLKALNKIGCTATFHRADGMQEAIKFLFGDIIHEVTKDKVADKTIKAKVVKRDTKFILEPYADCIDSDGTLNFTKFISELCEDEERNRMIAEDIKSNKGKSCIVLSQRLGQLEQIKEMVGEGVMIHGKMTTKKGKLEREKAIQDMREGKQKILYASYNLAKEGLDVPRLNRLFLASPAKDKAVIIQSVGRIERKCLKEEPVAYDYVDNLGITLGMWKKRRAIYNKNNNEVMG